MPFTLRPLQLPEDYAGIAAVMNTNLPEPTSAEKLAEDDAKIPTQNLPRVNEAGQLTGFYRERLVAVDEQGCIVGYLVGWRSPWTDPGYMNSHLFVHPAHQKQGIGTALADHLEHWAEQLGATLQQSEMRDHLPDARSFVEKRGYVIDRHAFESTLDLATFDWAPYAGVVEAVEASGIRFLTLADCPGEGTEQALYELFKATWRDIPGQEAAIVMPYSEWRDWSLEDARPEDVLLAYAGDRLVGTAVLHRNKETGGVYNEYTGVDRAYRGRRIARALKLLSIRIGQRYQAPYMRTDNDSQNGAMLAINRKLGYVPAPGIYVIRKVLSPSKQP